jgi:DUF4097 and DUF4098 domain-containing protein YvlB
MKEEITRINKLVAEGRLTPEEAADLIEAIANRQAQAGGPSASGSSAAAGNPTESASNPRTKDPIKGVFDFLDRLAKDGKDSVDWDEVSVKAKETARRGVEVLRQGIDDISKGKINIDWLTTSERKEIEFDLPDLQGKLLRIDNPSGSVRIVGGSDEASVTATAHFRGSSPEDAQAKAANFTLSSEISDHVVLIRHPELPGVMLDLVINVPVGTPVELKLEAGDATVKDTLSSVRLISRSGSVNLSGLDGTIEVTSDGGAVEITSSRTPSLMLEHKSGNVTFRHIEGNINARTASGDLTVVGSNGKVISLESVSGDVEVHTTGVVDGTLNIRTVSGDARVVGNGLINARVALSTLRGTVKNSVTLSEAVATEQRVTGRLGEGQGLIDVSAVTGDITFSPSVA